MPQPYSLSATLFEEAISTVEPVGVATSSQERSAVAGKVKVPTSLERSNNSVEEEKSGSIQMQQLRIESQRKRDPYFGKCT